MTNNFKLQVSVTVQLINTKNQATTDFIDSSSLVDMVQQRESST